MLVSQLFPWIPNHIHIQSTCPVPLFHANGLAEAKTNLQPHPAPLTYRPSCCVMPHLPHFLSLHIPMQTHRALFFHKTFLYLPSAGKQEWPSPTGFLLDYNDTAPLTLELCRLLPSVAIAHGSSCPEVITTHSHRSRSLGLLLTPTFPFLCPHFQLLHPVVSWLQSCQDILHECLVSSHPRAFVLVVSAKKAISQVLLVMNCRAP